MRGIFDATGHTLHSARIYVASEYLTSGDEIAGSAVHTSLAGKPERARIATGDVLLVGGEFELGEKWQNKANLNRASSRMLRMI